MLEIIILGSLFIYLLITFPSIIVIGILILISIQVFKSTELFSTIQRSKLKFFTIEPDKEFTYENPFDKITEAHIESHIKKGSENDPILKAMHKELKLQVDRAQKLEDRKFQKEIQDQQRKRTPICKNI